MCKEVEVVCKMVTIKQQGREQLTLSKSCLLPTIDALNTFNTSSTMIGAFRASHVSFSGLLWYVVFTYTHIALLMLIHRKTPWKLSVTRKANQRKRLKRVDSVIEAVRASGVQCAALVRQISTFP